MSQSRYDDVVMADFLKQNYFNEKWRRADWVEYFGPAYRDVPTQIELRDNKKRQTKEVRHCAPKTMPGDDAKKLHCQRNVLPVIKFPKKAEMRQTTDMRLWKRLEERYGNAHRVNISNMHQTIDPVIKESLFDGIAHHEKGRYQYLQSRKRTIPEKKYRSRMTSSMDYGWQVVDKMRPFKVTSCFGISSVAKGKRIQTEFKRNNGVTNPSFESAGLSMAM